VKNIGLKASRVKQIAFTFFFLFLTSSVQAQTDSIQARLNSLMQDPLLERTQLGLMVYDITADRTIYSYGARQTLRPASTMKLLTAVTALDLLGGDYLYRTSLHYTGEVRNRVLIGDIYCVGGMDPMFDEEDMNSFVRSILALGIDSIQGRLVSVTSFKEENLWGEGWCWDDDNPQLTPLLVMRKNEFLDRLSEKLRRSGVRLFNAPYATEPLPKNALNLGTRFRPLKDILVPMLKESDNLYAESMFFQIAAQMGPRPAKAVHARQLIKATLGKAGVANIEYKIADGSGLSLYNYVTPELMVKLLVYAYRKPAIIQHLYSALPIAGEDGTLKKRMLKTPAKGRVRAKTGTLEGISSLAGYCPTAEGHMLAFCIINQGVMKNTDGREFQDKLCTILCKSWKR
jgi:D-alanyl-D-alanine carboxypeptidase/D-alanyl-D-alanine-endopeptidase (penicillin-binding protein 4)